MPKSTNGSSLRRRMWGDTSPRSRIAKMTMTPKESPDILYKTTRYPMVLTSTLVQKSWMTYRMAQPKKCHLSEKGRKYLTIIRRELLAIYFWILIMKMFIQIQKKSCKFWGVASICLHTIWILVSCLISMSRNFYSIGEIIQITCFKIIRRRASSLLNAFNSKVSSRKGSKSSKTPLPFLTFTKVGKICRQVWT